MVSAVIQFRTLSDADMNIQKHGKHEPGECSPEVIKRLERWGTNPISLNGGTLDLPKDFFSVTEGFTE
jgi:hypothetical protein